MTRILAFAFVVLTLALSACLSTTPIALELEAPASAAENQRFTLTVTAVEGGRRRDRGFGGSVALSVSQGTVTPASLELEGGRGSARVHLSGVTAGEVTISATGGGASGSAALTLAPITALPGDAAAPATEAIPEVVFTVREEDYDDGHPDLGGVMVSFNTLLLAFELDTTVAEANAVLEELDATVVGGLPGVAGQLEGVLMIRLPGSTHQRMGAVVDDLRARPEVKHAVPDSLLETPDPELSGGLRAEAITDPNGGTPAGWSWELTPGGGNWGLELIRAPQLWNLNAAVGKQGTTTITGVLDNGFSTGHPDLGYLQNFSPATQENHGTHVAGTIGASVDNGVGVDGVSPFAQLVVRRHASGSSSGLFDLIDARPDVQVVNISLGYNWYKNNPPIDPATSLYAQVLVSEKAHIFRLQLEIREALGQQLPFILVAAGNDSGSTLGNVDARWSSPFTYAALELGVDNILVVEAIRRNGGATGGASRAGFSNLGGHLSAPGVAILSTYHTSPYKSIQGTSMATPHVTGLASYLLSLEPDLSHSQLRQLLLQNATGVAGGASNRIDAFAAALDIDGVVGGDRILRMLVDIDDGTPDGNQRVVFEGNVDLTDEDADLDGGVGDGLVDMADFRRWRDWLLQVEGGSDVMLDGSPDHSKRDVNGDGAVETPEAENVYPRGDFNGDGILSRAAAATGFVPGAIGAQATDLEVLMAVFSDPHYQAAQLPELLDSADITIDLNACFALPDVATVRTSVRLADGGALVEAFEHAEPGFFVHTVVADSDAYRVQIEARDGDGEILGVREFTTGLLMPGGDSYWLPTCTPVVVEITFPGTVEAGTPTPLLVRAGIASDGQVAYQPDWLVELQVQGGAANPVGGVTDADGFFEALVTAAADSETVTIFVTVSDDVGDEVTTAVASAEVTQTALFLFTFDDDLEDWESGTSGQALDGVDHSEYGNPDGSVRLDGSDFGNADDEPNAWIFRTLALPNDTGSLSIDVSADPNGAADPLNDAALRVRLLDSGGAPHVLLDWQIFVGLTWHQRVLDLAPFAGQTVTLIFEQDDDGEGVGEFIFLDNVRIDRN